MSHGRLALVVGALALAASACSATVSGHGSAAIGPSPSGASTAGSTPGPATTSARPPAPRVLSAAELDRLLEPAPAGATAWHSSWARNRNPTPSQFAHEVYRAQVAREQAQLLRAQGLTVVAHRAWYATDADQADMVLLEFASAAGAQSRFLAVTSADRTEAGIHSFRVPGRRYTVGYYTNRLDALGNVKAVLYCQVRNIVVEEFYFSPAVLKQADAITWMRRQLQLLG